MRLCDMMRMYRESRGWTRRWLGEQVGGDYGYINNIEIDRRNISLPKAVEIARVFGHTPHEWIEAVFHRHLEHAAVPGRVRYETRR